MFPNIILWCVFSIHTFRSTCFLEIFFRFSILTFFLFALDLSLHIRFYFGVSKNPLISLYTKNLPPNSTMCITFNILILNVFIRFECHAFILCSKLEMNWNPSHLFSAWKIFSKKNKKIAACKNHITHVKLFWLSPIKYD